MIGNRGVAFVIVIVVIASLFTLGSTLLFITMGEYRSVRRDIARTSALYAAEAGIERAIAELHVDPDWDGVISGVFSDAGSSFSAYTQRNGHLVVITATGICDNMSRMIAAEVRIIEPPLIDGQLPPYVLYVNTNHVFQGRNSYTGDIYVGGDVEFPPPRAMQLDGILYYVGEVVGPKPGNVDTEQIAPLPILLPDMDALLAGATQYFDEPIVINGGDYDEDIIFVDAEQVVVSGSFSGKVTIACPGKIMIGSIQTIGFESGVLLAAGEAVENLTDEGLMVNAVAWAPRIELSVSSLSWDGALIGTEIMIDTNERPEWKVDLDLLSNPPPLGVDGDTTIRVERWMAVD